MFGTIFAALLAVASPLPAGPATLSGTLAAPGVVWVSDGSSPARSSGAVMTQTDRTFSPELAVVTAGSVVRFRNDDTVDHSVYSISPAGPFDLGIYEPGPGKDVTFARTGVVEIRCHIHRHMHATLVVVDGPHARVETVGGDWSIANVRDRKSVV